MPVWPAMHELNFIESCYGDAWSERSWAVVLAEALAPAVRITNGVMAATYQVSGTHIFPLPSTSRAPTPARARSTNQVREKSSCRQ
jgi:hypothetical protein